MQQHKMKTDLVVVKMVIMMSFLATLSGICDVNGTSLAEVHSSVAEVTSVSQVPELKFSKKLLSFPLPKGVQKTAKDDVDAVEFGQKGLNEIFRRVAPYVPDVFYEKAQLPFADREKFLNSAEKREIIKILQKRYEPTLGREKFWNKTLMQHLLNLCDEMVIYGRPLASIRAETKSIREAVDLCGMTQLGYWMDVSKAKYRDYQKITPEDYDEREARRETEYMGHLANVYGSTAYGKAVGLRPEKPINADCPYYSAEDFAHLSLSQKKELLDMFKILPDRLRSVPGISPRMFVNDYLAIRADTTGFSYVTRYAPKKLKKEQAIKLQKLCLEILTYTHPLALLKIKDYSLERVMFKCGFLYADKFYQKKKRHDEQKPKKLSEKEQVIYDREAQALMDLGKRFNRPDWVQFGQEMYEAGQKQKTNDR